MGFGMKFFQGLKKRIEDYLEEFPCAFTLVRVRADGQEGDLIRITRCEQSLLTFAYYAEQKEYVLPQEVQEATGKERALPVLTLPYSAVRSVEILPAAPDILRHYEHLAASKRRKIGFHEKTQ